MAEIKVQVSKKKKPANNALTQNISEIEMCRQWAKDPRKQLRKNFVQSDIVIPDISRTSSYEIVTVPDINKSWVKLVDICKQFKSALSGVKRIENYIYPLLEEENQFLNEPDFTITDELLVINMQIEWSIS